MEMDVYSHLLEETGKIEKDKTIKALKSMAQQWGRFGNV